MTPNKLRSLAQNLFPLTDRWTDRQTGRWTTGNKKSSIELSAQRMS